MDKDKNAPGKPSDPTQQVKLLLIIVLVVAVAVPFVSSQMAVKSISAHLEKMNGATQSETEEKSEAEGKVVFYEPMEFLVNLADAEASHYLRTTVSLGSKVAGEVHEQGDDKKSAGGGAHGGGNASAGAEEAKPAIFEKFKMNEPIIRDIIISVISTYPMVALVSANGKQELKETIKHRLEKELATENIAVYFTAFTLQ